MNVYAMVHWIIECSLLCHAIEGSLILFPVLIRKWTKYKFDWHYLTWESMDRRVIVLRLSSAIQSISNEYAYTL